MIQLTDKQNMSSKKQKVCYVCIKGFSTDDNNTKYDKVRDHCYNTGKSRETAHDICNLRYQIPKEIPVVFFNGSHFIIKKLAKHFQGQFECLGEKIEKYITFSVSIKKEIDNGNWQWQFWQ